MALHSPYYEDQRRTQVPPRRNPVQPGPQPKSIENDHSRTHAV